MWASFLYYDVSLIYIFFKKTALLPQLGFRVNLTEQKVHILFTTVLRNLITQNELLFFPHNFPFLLFTENAFAYVAHVN